jgi:hypothetical protein
MTRTRGRRVALAGRSASRRREASPIHFAQLTISGAALQSMSYKPNSQLAR